MMEWVINAVILPWFPGCFPETICKIKVPSISSENKGKL